jgi:hypothetical protein
MHAKPPPGLTWELLVLLRLIRVALPSGKMTEYTQGFPQLPPSDGIYSLAWAFASAPGGPVWFATDKPLLGRFDPRSLPSPYVDPRLRDGTGGVRSSLASDAELLPDKDLVFGSALTPTPVASQDGLYELQVGRPGHLTISWALSAARAKRSRLKPGVLASASADIPAYATMVPMRLTKLGNEDVATLSRRYPSQSYSDLYKLPSAAKPKLGATLRFTIRGARKPIVVHNSVTLVP